MAALMSIWGKRGCAWTKQSNVVSGQVANGLLVLLGRVGITGGGVGQKATSSILLSDADVWEYSCILTGGI